MNELLNHKIYGSSGPNIFIVHGLFGTLDNWHSFAKELSEDYRVITVDLRNHGRSFHTYEFDYPVLAEDLNLLWHELSDNMPSIWLGHSLGGKAVIQLANDFPESVYRLIVVDIGIKQSPKRHTSYFDALHALPLNNITSRKQADKILMDSIPDWSIRQFLLKNLHRSREGFSWKFNLTSIYRNYNQILEELDVDLAVPTLFIKGGKSNYILVDDIPHILERFENGEIKTIEEAGHWVHADQPKMLIQLVKNYLA